MEAMQTAQSQPQGQAVLAARAIGAMFFFAFGGLWLTGWALNSHRGGTWIVPIIVAAAVLCGIARRRYQRHAPALALEKDTPARRRAGRVFNIVNAAQWIVIVGAGIAMRNLGYGIWVIPMAIGVIGLHFFPLAAVFNNPPHYVTGTAMVALAVLYPLLAEGGPASPLGFLGAGIILWLSALWALRPAAAQTAS
jgi:hypothetical protein